MAAFSDDFITGDMFDAILDDYESEEIDLNELYLKDNVEDDKETSADVFVCKNCPKKYSKKKSLETHVRKKHAGQDGNENPISKPKERDIIGQRPAIDVNTARTQASSILKSAFVDLTNDSLAATFPPGSSGARANEAARKICSASIIPTNDEKFQKFGEKLYDTMSEVILSGSAKKLDSSMKYTMLQHFHQTQIDSGLNQDFSNFYTSLGVDYVGKLLNANVKWTYFIKLCNIVTPTQSANMTSECDSSMSKEEESTLRYIAGFIPFSLTKRYRRFKHAKFGLYIDCLQNWRANDDHIDHVESLQDYTKAWTTTINRGGLFKVNNAVYSFFHKLECIVRQQLNIETVMADISINLKKELHHKISSNNAVKFAWEDIAQSIESDSLRFDLFHIVTAKFINLRADSFVRFWKKRLAGKGKVHGKSTQSLRSSLAS